MGIALSVAGILLIVTGAQNTYGALGNQLRGDFTGQNNFTWWFLAIMSVGMLGYIPQARTFSRMFLALILIAILFSHKGFFAMLTQALQSGPKATQVQSAPAQVTPQQGIQQGRGGVGIDWLAPLKGLFQ